MTPDHLAAEGRALLAKAVAKTTWGASEISVDFSDDDAHGSWPEWFVHANGVGSYPIGQFHRKEDAEAWAWLFNNADTLLSALASLDRMTEAVVKARDRFREKADESWDSAADSDMANELDRVLGSQVGEEG